jgi:hypothetical protein
MRWVVTIPIEISLKLLWLTVLAQQLANDKEQKYR